MSLVEQETIEPETELLSEAAYRKKASEFEFIEWCREVAQHQFTLNPNKRLTYLEVSKDPDGFWRKMWNLGYKAKTACECHPMNAVQTEPDGFKNGQPVTIHRTVVRS